jgi:hypothetical protein
MPDAALGGASQQLVDYDPYLPAEQVAELVDDYIRNSDVRPWNSFRSFPWDEIAPERLTSAHRSAVQFVTFIEDHVPAYFAEVYRRYPMDERATSSEFMHNRELFRFYARWVADEESHAHVLFRYQVLGKLCDAATLRAKLAGVGPARFDLPGRGPVPAITYAVLQEKATQLFYSQFAHTAADPLLQEVMRCMARDESRHYAFFSRLLAKYLEHFGAAILPDVERTLRCFKMPLANVLTNYWRWSIEIADGVGGYAHTQAYPALLKTLHRVNDPAVRNKTKTIEAFIHSICSDAV